MPSSHRQIDQVAFREANPRESLSLTRLRAGTSYPWFPFHLMTGSPVSYKVFVRWRRYLEPRHSTQTRFLRHSDPGGEPGPGGRSLSVGPEQFLGRNRPAARQWVERS